MLPSSRCLIRSPQWPDFLRLAEPAVANLPGPDQGRSGLDRRWSDQIAGDLANELSGDIDQRPVRAPQLAKDGEMVGAFNREKPARRTRGQARLVKLD